MLRLDRAVLPLVFTGLTLSACNGKDAADDTSGADDTAAMGGITISGTAHNLLSGEAAATGLCVRAADPTEAISGGELTILSEGTLGDGGAYSLSHVANTSAVGLLMLVEDCDGSGTVMPTATGIKDEIYSVMSDGEELADYLIYSIDGTSQAALQGGLAAAGYTGDLGTEGALVGFVLDAAGAPVDGAVVKGPESNTVYYANGDGSFNLTGSVAAAKSMFLIPGAPVYSYKCTEDAHTFPSSLAGSQPGYAVLITFVANE